MKQDKFEMSTPIMGKNPMVYMAELLAKNERQEIDIERGKVSIGLLKQMNNRSRLLLDAAKYELKKGEVVAEANFLRKENKEAFHYAAPLMPAERAVARQ